MTSAVTLPLVFGAAPIGGLYAPVSDAGAAATLAAAWQAGIRAFDTAPHYGVGLSERRLGDFLADRPRSEFIVSTKVGRRLVPASGPVDGVDGFYGTPPLSRVRDYTADGVRRCLEDSLWRLRLDRVDIALIHDPDDFMTQALDSADDIRPYVEFAIELFGPGRLMFGSDWPVAELAGGYERVWAAISLILGELPPADRDAILGGTASAFYHLTKG